MFLLHLIWVTALVLVAGSLLWMSGLIALRLVHTHRSAVRKADRRAVEKALVALLLGKCDLAKDLGPYAGRGRLMAESLLEFLALVRGHDRAVVISALESLQVDRTLRGRITRGSRAGRLACIEALAAFPGEETERALTGLLSRAAPQVRLAALKSLAQRGGAVPLARLLADLRSGALPLSGLLGEFMREVVATDPATAAAALQPETARAVKVLLLDALGVCGDYAALPALVSQAQAPEAEVRAAAVTAVGRLKHPGALGCLRQALEDGESRVRAAAAEAVGAAGLTALAEPLAARLSDPVWRVRFQAAAGLRLLGTPGLALLRQAAGRDDDLARRAASLALAEQGIAA